MVKKCLTAGQVFKVCQRAVEEEQYYGLLMMAIFMQAKFRNRDGYPYSMISVDKCKELLDKYKSMTPGERKIEYEKIKKRRTEHETN